MRSLFGRSVAVAYGIRVVAPVRVFAVAVLAQVAPFALAAHDVVLHENQIAFLEAFAPGELTTHFSDVTDIFVAHDHGSFGRRRCIHLHVSSTNPADFHPEQSAILRNFRHGEVADLRHARTDSYGCEYLFQTLLPPKKLLCGFGGTSASDLPPRAHVLCVSADCLEGNLSD